MSAKIIRQSGFSAVELLITLFIAAAFLMSGYQLYSTIIKKGASTRAQTKASNVLYDYLTRYKDSATSPCTIQNPLTDSSITVDTLSNVTVSVAITCPYTSITSISKVQVTLKYNNPQQTISNATFVKL
ncbi:prepilin-type N-terminal cleavage/methylation domain-containing protein [Candidatus Saccharibacteria bacterium]|nr:prepilin-type N-terminal cleavage/methylation domain-containing protein [Candidatus Saccharibacteria bacterium]